MKSQIWLIDLYSMVTSYNLSMVEPGILNQSFLNFISKSFP